ncbi:uncharacterized protein Tco025E_00407 [Trypanosoma conorhini]|uniref:Uncharacterized protein n=1 Tax=Trypanosoma conorhini TaxID=83891 RepID=A0A3R7N8V1_9TRYP|nr:uncharacterized protein Tco025E_00407 [Trypanosoma conorhini]RNF27337.1 hypothetical protein Tco025E_00407 [Trypanosoma conorhini]
MTTLHPRIKSAWSRRSPGEKHAFTPGVHPRRQLRSAQPPAGRTRRLPTSPLFLGAWCRMSRERARAAVAPAVSSAAVLPQQIYFAAVNLSYQLNSKNGRRIRGA